LLLDVRHRPRQYWNLSGTFLSSGIAGLTQQLTQCSKMTQQLVSLLQLLQLYRETKSSADPGGAEASSFGAAPQQPLSGSMSRRRQTNPLLSVK
jgi:hypothetical protein